MSPRSIVELAVPPKVKFNASDIPDLTCKGHSDRDGSQQWYLHLREAVQRWCTVLRAQPRIQKRSEYRYALSEVLVISNKFISIDPQFP